MKNLITGLLIGLFATLWWTERQRRTTPAAAGAPRPLEVLSPTYAQNPHPHKELHVIPRDQLYTFTEGVTQELVRPDLSAPEAKAVAAYLRQMILSATVYYKRRERMQNARADAWLNEAMWDDDDEDTKDAP